MQPEFDNPVTESPGDQELPGAHITARVAFIVSHSSAGGVQQIWANLAEGFQHRGFATNLVALYPNEQASVEKSETIPWDYIVDKRPLSLFSQIRMLVSLIAFFRSQRPRFAFTAMPAANALVPIAAIMSGTDVKIVTSHHSPTDTYSKALQIADGVIGQLGIVRAVVSVSNAVSNSLEKRSRIYKKKRYTIYNALPPTLEVYLERLATLRKERRSRGRVVVAAGRLAAQKNYPVLIRASAHMPDVTVQIIGAGNDETALKEMSKNLGVDNRIQFLGRRSREETLRIVSEADIFAQPSLFEGHSLALVEAAKLGLPIIVSDVPVQIEGITSASGEQRGISVPVHDDIELARSIQTLLDDEVVYRLYSNHARILANEITFDRMINSYIRLMD